MKKKSGWYIFRVIIYFITLWLLIFPVYIGMTIFYFIFYCAFVFPGVLIFGKDERSTKSVVKESWAKFLLLVHYYQDN